VSLLLHNFFSIGGVVGLTFSLFLSSSSLSSGYSIKLALLEYPTIFEKLHEKFGYPSIEPLSWCQIPCYRKHGQDKLAIKP